MAVSIDHALAMAVAHHDAGRLHQAESIYRQILAHVPEHPEALRMLALVAFQVGRAADALPLIERAIRARPAAADYHANLGVILASLNRLDDAVHALRQSMVLNPSDPETLVNLANVLVQKRRFDEAIELYRRAIASGRQLPEAHYNLGRALQEKGDLDAACNSYRTAIALNPNNSDALNNLGNAQRTRGRSTEAIDAYRRALAVRPQFPEAWNNLGNTFLGKGKIDEAIDAYRQALSLRPDYAMAHNNLGNAFKESGRTDDAIDSLRRAATLSDDALLAGNLLYVLHFHPDSTPKSLYDEHAKWNERFAKPIAASHPTISSPRSPERPLRIGYVSPNFREHPVGRFMLPLLANHDRGKFQIHCYTDLTVPDALTDRLKSHVDVWRPTNGLSDAQLADLIRSDHIDILVDLTMHMSGSRLLAFARKPAPVQITYLAYCSTTGLDSINYRLSDPHLDPPGSDESVYSERTVRLPQTYWCYPEPENAPEAGPSPAVSSGHVTFGCFNNFSKVTRPTLETWARLMDQVPASRLILHAHEGAHRQAALDLFASHGIEPDRIEFKGFSRLGDYLGQYNGIDIALDPFPYGGGTTTCDALYMGVPVVSLQGATAVSRAGKSILTNVGLADLVAEFPDQYVEIASRLAGDLPRLTELRSQLRQRLKDSPLMDAVQFARDLEEVYRRLS